MLLEAIRSCGEEVEKRLHHAIAGEGEDRPAIELATKAAGLRLRPFLFRTVFENLGGQSNTAWKTTVAVEAIHLATLVLDDLIDNSRERNGQESVVEAHGTASAVSSAEFLNALAFDLIAQDTTPSHSEQCAEIIRLFTHALTTIYRAQLRQDDRRLTLIDENAWLRYNQATDNRSAGLFEASLASGALLAGQEALIQQLKTVGQTLGRFVQKRNDLLDAYGTRDVLGREPCGDITRRQVRLPILAALEVLQLPDREQIVSYLTQYGSEISATKIIDLVRKAEVFDRAYQVVLEEHAALQRTLEDLPAEPGSGTMADTIALTSDLLLRV